MKRAAAVVALIVVTLAVAYAAGSQDTPPTAPYDVQRLGPEPGERVADYLPRAAATLPAPGAGPVWALVQLADPVDTAAAATLVSGVRLSRVVFRVPLPRVQTALVTRELPGQRPADELADAQRFAADDRDAAAARASGARAVAVAAAEADALRAGCACVLAMLVSADGPALVALASHPGVRAVHAATPATPLPAVALSPLLPEQTDVAGPVPDDGPID
jgi:hypothetical protein